MTKSGFINTKSVSSSSFVFDSDLVPTVDNAFYIASQTKGLKGMHFGPNQTFLVENGNGILEIRRSNRATNGSIESDGLISNGVKLFSTSGQYVTLGGYVSGYPQGRFVNMTTAQKNALAGAIGGVVYDTDLDKLCVWTGAAWETVTSV